MGKKPRKHGGSRESFRPVSRGFDGRTFAERLQRRPKTFAGRRREPSARRNWKASARDSSVTNPLASTPAAFRKRLERTRTRIRGFMESTCGLVNPNAFCRCTRRVPPAIALGRIDPDRPAFVTHPVSASGRDVAQATRHAAQRRCRTEGAPRLRRASIEGRRDRGVAAVRAIPDAGMIRSSSPSRGVADRDKLVRLKCP
jgi:hypothetical protein